MNETVEASSESALMYKELECRREKQWRIFSWCGTLLVAIIGGIVALAWRPDDPTVFTCIQATILSVAILALVLYAELWLGHNWKHEDRLAGELKLKTIEPFFGYTWAIGLLAVAALAAIWMHP
jgi:hypothetical protein